MKNTLFKLIIFIGITFSCSLAASEHPIDNNLSKCLAKKENTNTAGMTNCTYKALEQWQEELNIVYTKLLKNLDPISKTKLEESQNTWLHFRDQEAETITKIYNKPGTIYIPMQAMDLLMLTKNRVLDLNGYLNAIGIK